MLSVLFLAGSAIIAETGQHGPYNVHFLAGGDGVIKPVAESGSTFPASLRWSLAGWINADTLGDHVDLLAGFGTMTEAGGRYLALDHGRLALWSDGKILLRAKTPIAAQQWIWVAASADGAEAHLWQDGIEIAHLPLAGNPASATIGLGLRPAGQEGFAGHLAALTLSETPLSADQAKAQAATRPDIALTRFEDAAAMWPVQVHQMYGQAAPQDAWTLPKSKAAFGAPHAKAQSVTAGLTATGADHWTLGDFRLQAEPKVTGDGSLFSQVGYDSADWYQATVPGTILTTLVDRGIYPDPDFGLNNLAIPESLNQQRYWYRSEFTLPADLAGRHLQLTFNGINYAAQIWLNGVRLGDIKGAFIRGRFDITATVRPGQRNALAVLVAPPPHPGIAHEQSISAGVGENGGYQALDGPTFIASEGWDWIPGVRDRNTGLWQDVTLDATGMVRIGDVQVVTSLPLPDRSRADVSVTLPLDNLSDHAVTAVVDASFDDVAVRKTVQLPPGASEIALTPADFPQLQVKNPKLWWPNGLGEPALHQLHLTVSADGAASAAQDVRFGMREITYELSLMDPSGHLRRVEIDPTRSPGVPLVDGSHQGVRKIAGGWVQSLTKAGASSPAVTPLGDRSLTPYLVIRVNGVRVPARGGSWGTDDWRKRVSRARLEPFFRLHRQAHVNIIRNWVGQNTEEAFYDLADEYGLLVLNDFWESTQDYNIEAEDVPLFLANAADVIRHYRNHPSIALWFGRNEGMPQPILNEGLQRLVTTLDGTRHYMGSSNRINLQDSGPYDYREPASYFTTYSKGFAVEVGQPSFPTAEAFKAAIPPEDLWPINDVWAYHDWHQTGNGATAKFMTALEAKFGAAQNFDDFERKAQMLTYESYRAIFEGMNAELWSKTSGRMLWMTQPAWPSTNWQIMSSDYDTHGAFYGMQKASEPLHVQMDLPDFALTLVNNTQAARQNLTLRWAIHAIDGTPLQDSQSSVALPADAAVKAGSVPLAPWLAKQGVVLVSLQLTDAAGKILSDNFYWQGAHDSDLRALSGLPAQTIALAARRERRGGDILVTVTMTNRGDRPALMNKLTVQQADGSRLLPAYADGNYISLLPGQSHDVQIAVPADAVQGPISVALRGWNAQPVSVGIP